jgi:hypothetical protein
MFKLSAEDRLRSWRDFRNSLDSLSLEQALAHTAELWARAPFSPYYLDIKDPDSWPDPWQLINENYYCDIAKCLGIIYTIALTTHRTDLEIEFRSYTDPKNRHSYNLSWFNEGKYILNLIDGEIVNKEQFDKTFRLNQVIAADKLQIEHI